jgi:phosphate transport system substrate-binding protein
MKANTNKKGENVSQVLSNKLRNSIPLVFGILLVLAVAACGGSSEADGSLRGSIEIDGSSTVFPISESAAYEFRKVHSGVQVNVGVSGTGGGFKRFVTNETDINDASRPIKPSEAAQAAEAGIEFLELRVAIDGLSVMVHPENSFVSCLTIEELKLIWEPGSTVKTWQDVKAEWPNEDIRLYGPDTDSGTFDYFTEVVVGEIQASRADYTASANDNVLIQGIEGDRKGLGYFGYAYYIENADKLKLVAIDSGNGCVTPTAKTIESGEYAPLSRPVFIYVNKKSLERPEMQAFVEFYLSNSAQIAESVGYVPLSQTMYQEELELIKP